MSSQLDRIEAQLKAIAKSLETLGLSVGKNPRRTIAEIDAQVAAKVLKLTSRRKKG